MAFGFGILDYIVTLGCVAITVMLLGRPQQLLILLPLMISIDFILPIAGTILTPGHLVPLVLGLGMLFRPVARFPRAMWSFVLVYLVIVGTATGFGIAEGGAGSRPVIRAAFYINILIVFLYAYSVTARSGSALPILKGLALAAIVHAGLGFYQILADITGLPYRGVVYNESGYGRPVSQANGGFRINGLADEPKRMAFITFAGAIALVILGNLRLSRLHNRAALAGMSAIASVLTVSSSFFVAVAVWIGHFVTRPRYLAFALFAFLVTMGLVLVIAPDFVSQQLDFGSNIVDRRMQELEVGIEGENVYRQEFYAFEYLANHSQAAITGVGMGRYNYELFLYYGAGVGLSEEGNIMPLNSQLLEVLFDLGLAGLAILVFGPLLLLVRSDASSFATWWFRAIVAFLWVQSFFVQDLLYLGLVCGALFATQLRAASAPALPASRPVQSVRMVTTN